MMVIKLRVLSLGAGVQSTAVALMAARGELSPMPDCAIFADTGWEPAHVYDHLTKLEQILPFPVYKVSNGNLRSDIASVRPHGRFLKVDIPAFVSVNGKPSGLINRSCTRDYKIDPIRKKVRELLGLTRKRSPKEPVVEQWIGISLDEAIRMKPSRDAWIINRWPLIEKFMKRTDCLRWMRENGYDEPKKSSCIGCPFHSDAEWKSLSQAEMKDAIEIDDRLRDRSIGITRTKGELYLHRSCKPLSEIDFHARRHDDGYEHDLFGNECEGVCGV